MDTLDTLLEREQVDRAIHLQNMEDIRRQHEREQVQKDINLQYLKDLKRQHGGAAQQDTEGEIQFNLSQGQIAFRSECNKTHSDGSDGDETDDQLTGKVSHNTGTDSAF